MGVRGKNGKLAKNMIYISILTYKMYFIFHLRSWCIYISYKLCSRLMQIYVLWKAYTDWPYGIWSHKCNCNIGTSLLVLPCIFVETNKWVLCRQGEEWEHKSNIGQCFFFFSSAFIAIRYAKAYNNPGARWVRRYCLRTVAAFCLRTVWCSWWCGFEHL